MNKTEIVKTILAYERQFGIVEALHRVFEKNIKTIDWSDTGSDWSNSGDLYYASYCTGRSGYHDAGRSCK